MGLIREAWAITNREQNFSYADMQGARGGLYVSYVADVSQNSMRYDERAGAFPRHATRRGATANIAKLPELLGNTTA
jgi:hypothetical protein